MNISKSDRSSYSAYFINYLIPAFVSGPKFVIKGLMSRLSVVRYFKNRYATIKAFASSKLGSFRVGELMTYEEWSTRNHWVEVARSRIKKHN